MYMYFYGIYDKSKAPTIYLFLGGTGFFWKKIVCSRFCWGKKCFKGWEQK